MREHALWRREFVRLIYLMNVFSSIYFEIVVRYVCVPKFCSVTHISITKQKKFISIKLVNVFVASFQIKKKWKKCLECFWFKWKKKCSSTVQKGPRVLLIKLNYSFRLITVHLSWIAIQWHEHNLSVDSFLFSSVYKKAFKWFYSGYRRYSIWF